MIAYSCINIVPSKSEKHIIFLLVPMLDVSCRCIEGLGTLEAFCTSTSGGVIADGAMFSVGRVIGLAESGFKRQNYPAIIVMIY